MSMTIDQQHIVETTQDIQDFLLEPSTTYPSDVKNNIPNATNNGSFPVWYGGTYTIGGDTSIRVGQNAGLTNFKDHSIALGTNAGRHENGTASVALGFNAQRTHGGTYAIAIGYLAGNITQGESSIAIGNGAGKNAQSDWCVAIGNSAGTTGQRNNSVAIGAACGNFNQGTNSVAIGLYSGFTGQGENCIAIGNQAGMTSQPNNSIVLSASGNPLSGNTSNAFFVDPVRNITTGSNVLCYDTTNKEISYASNISLANPLTVTQGSATLPSINFQGDTNTGIFSSTADTLDFSTGGTSRMNINNSRTFVSSGQLVIPAGSVSAPGLTWTGASINTGLYLPSQDIIGISCDGNLRCSFGTSAITMATSLYLPTSGGTSSALDFYEEYSHTTAWNYGNKTNQQSLTIYVRRIGKMVMCSFTNEWSGSVTNTDGTTQSVVSATTLPTRFRPVFNSNAVGIINIGGKTQTCRIGVLSNGNIEFTYTNGNGFSSGTSITVFANLWCYGI